MTPVPHAHHRSSALGRNECRCRCLEVISRHPDPRVARHLGLNFQKGGPQLAQGGFGPRALLDPGDGLLDQLQPLVDGNLEGEFRPADGWFSHLV